MSYHPMLLCVGMHVHQHLMPNDVTVPSLKPMTFGMSVQASTTKPKVRSLGRGTHLCTAVYHASTPISACHFNGFCKVTADKMASAFPCHNFLCIFLLVVSGDYWSLQRVLPFSFRIPCAKHPDSTSDIPQNLLRNFIALQLTFYKISWYLLKIFCLLQLKLLNLHYFLKL